MTISYESRTAKAGCNNGICQRKFSKLLSIKQGKGQLRREMNLGSSWEGLKELGDNIRQRRLLVLL